MTEDTHTTEKVRVELHAYRGIFIIDTKNPEVQEKNWVPAGGDRFGCVVIGSKERLCISQDAADLLKKVATGQDALGDLMWWMSGEDACFGWLGGPKSLKIAVNIEGDRDFALREGHYTEIPNQVPSEIKELIDHELDSPQFEGSSVV